MNDLAPILLAVRQAADLCRIVQETHLLSGSKAGAEPVTIADYGTQAILCRAISHAFPDHAVISEEQGQQFVRVFNPQQRAHVIELVSAALGEPVTEPDVLGWLDHGRGRTTARSWMIDPIDGTASFMKLRPYTLAIGLAENGRMIEGILGAPLQPSDDGRGMLFYTKGGHAYREPMGGGPAVRVHVSQQTELSSVRIVQSPNAPRGDNDAITKLRQSAGIAVDTFIEYPDSQNKYLAIVTGDAELFIQYAPNYRPVYKVWDHAAGAALVEAAGGIVTDIHGDALDFGQGTTITFNNGVVAANPMLHERVLWAYQSGQQLATSI